MEIFLIVMILVIVAVLIFRSKKISNSTTDEIEQTQSPEIKITVTSDSDGLEEDDYSLDSWHKFYDEAEHILQEINDLKSKYFESLKCYDYDFENAKLSLPHVKQLFELHRKLLPIAKKHNISTEYDDFYVYNMANCFVALGRYDDAKAVFEYGFREIPDEGLHNLPNSFVDFIGNYAKTQNPEKALMTFFQFDSVISSEKRDWIEDSLTQELAGYFTETLYDKQNNTLENLKNKFPDSRLVQEVYKLSMVNYKVYRFINLAQEEFKAKNYENALDYFQKAEKNANQYSENIDSQYELYGDILYKLKSFKKAIAVYKRNVAESNVIHRVYLKIGDSYLKLNNADYSVKFYIMSLLKKNEYKTVQSKIIKNLSQLKLKTNLDEIIHLCKNNSKLSDQKFAKILNAYLIGKK